MAPKIIVITGPTATGKTEFSVLLAKAVGGEVVGADSMQIYKYMNIGTAKPTPDEMSGIPHHMIDFIHPNDNYSVSRYAEDAARCVDNILSRGKIPIITGGTGLYIEALISGREFAPEAVSTGLREELSALYDESGGEKMIEMLAEFDKESAQKLHPNDKKRIVRAFEVYRSSGKTISQHNAETQKLPPKYDVCKIALNFSDRADLYSRIDKRVDIMFERGLINEVQALLDMGIDKKCTAMQAIGYKETVGAILGRISFEQAAEDIKRESRRYAKRQISWIGRDNSAKWVNWDKIPDFGAGLQVSTNYLRAVGVI